VDVQVGWLKDLLSADRTRIVLVLVLVLVLEAAAR
jgi:hypothetical protein